MPFDLNTDRCTKRIALSSMGQYNGRIYNPMFISLPTCVCTAHSCFSCLWKLFNSRTNLLPWRINERVCHYCYSRSHTCDESRIHSQFWQLFFSSAKLNIWTFVFRNFEWILNPPSNSRHVVLGNENPVVVFEYRETETRAFWIPFSKNCGGHVWGLEKN